MVGGRIVKVDGYFHKSEPQNLRVEVEVALRIGCDGG